MRSGFRTAKKYFNELIFEIDNNPLQNYCCLLTEYIKKYKMNNGLSLLDLDLFRGISSNHRVVVQLLISSCLSGDSDTIYDIQEELPFHGDGFPFQSGKMFFKSVGLIWKNRLTIKH